MLVQPDLSTPWGLRGLAILSLMVYTGVRTVEVHRAKLVDLRTEGGQLVLYVTRYGDYESHYEERFDPQSPKCRLP